MSPLFYVLVGIAVIVTIVLIVFALLAISNKVGSWQETRGRRIRDSRSSWDLVKPYEPSARERRL